MNDKERIEEAMANQADITARAVGIALDAIAKLLEADAISQKDAAKFMRSARAALLGETNEETQNEEQPTATPVK